MLHKVMLAIIGILIATLGCAYASSHYVPTREEAAAVKLFFTSKSTRTGVIDLSIPENEKAYYTMLKVSGITPESRPEFFKKLAGVKSQHLALRAAGNPISDRACEVTMGNQLRHVFEVIGIASNDDFSIVNAKTLDSIYNGADDYHDTMQVWDSDFETMLSHGAAESSKQGNDGRRIIFDTSSDASNSQQEPVNFAGTYSYSKGTTYYGPCYYNLAQIHSVPRQMIPGDPKYVKNTAQSEPNGIIVCLNRANNDGSVQGQGDPCDYGPMYDPHVSNDQTHILLPVSGEVDYYDELQDGTAWQKGGQDAPVMWVMPRGTGGGCKLYVDNTDLTAFWSHFTPVNDKQGKKTRLTFSWPMSAPADFGQLCYQIAGPNAVWDFLLSFSVGTHTNTPGDDKQYTVQAVFTSDSGGSTTPNDVALTYPIQFQYGCVREGTLITMGDGSVKPIEQIKKGDVVLGKAREPVRVASTMIGTDEKFNQITDSQGHTVSVTPAHPIPTNRGMLQAKSVRLGDTVFTNDGGSATVTGNDESSLPRSARVYNLVLETAQGKRFEKPEDAVFYAGGMMVGDNNMQGILSRRSEAKAEHVPPQKSASSMN